MNTLTLILMRTTFLILHFYNKKQEFLKSIFVTISPTFIKKILLAVLTVFYTNSFAQEADLMDFVEKPKKTNCYSWKTVYSAGPYEIKYCASVDDPISKSWKTAVYFQSNFPESTYLILHADVRHKNGEFLSNKSVAGGLLYKGNGFQDYDLCDYVSFYSERIKYLKIGERIIYDEFQRK